MADTQRTFTPEEIAAVLADTEENAPEYRRLAEMLRELMEAVGEELPELTAWERDAILDRLKERDL